MKPHCANFFIAGSNNMCAVGCNKGVVNIFEIKK